MRILVAGFGTRITDVSSLSSEGELVAADSPEQADSLVARGDVDAVVAGPEPWVRTWVFGLPADTRPAVLLTGAPPERLIAQADDWAIDLGGAPELRARVRVAVQRSRLRRRAVRRGNVDPLTELPNRRGVIIALLHAAARHRRQGTRLSLVLVDLDNFKRVNEQQGHDAGDRLLRKVGRILRGSTRKDEVCGRIGGDEFVVVVSGDSKHADLVCRRIDLALRDEGIGATCVGEELADGEDVRELYRRVDTQLRARKIQIRDYGPTPLSARASAARPG